MGRSFVSHAGGNADSNPSSLPVSLAFRSNLNGAIQTYSALDLVECSITPCSVNVYSINPCSINS
jgi:hypothetical protein